MAMPVVAHDGYTAGQAAFIARHDWRTLLVALGLSGASFLELLRDVGLL